MIGAAAEAAVFEIAEAERDQRGFLEFERVGFFCCVIQRRQLLIHLDHFQRAFAQVVRLLGIEREYLISGGSLRDDDADDRLGAQGFHGR